MIFFIRPVPKGCEENQFAPFRVWGKQIDFKIKLLFVETIKNNEERSNIYFCFVLSANELINKLTK